MKITFSELPQNLQNLFFKIGFTSSTIIPIYDTEHYYIFGDDTYFFSWEKNELQNIINFPSFSKINGSKIYFTK